MKGIKNVIESAAVLCMAGALTITAVTSSDKAAGQAEESSGLENVGIAGVASVLNNYEHEMEEELQQLTVEKQYKEIVASPLVDTQMQAVSEMQTVSEGQENVQGTEEAQAAETQVTVQETTEVQAAEQNSGTQEEPELTEEEKEWQQYLMADVKEALNIRAKKSEDSEIVGKLRKGDRAVIKKSGKTWTKIESGSVTGYVKNEYCVMGSDALAYAKKNCAMIATVNIDGLRVRGEQSTDSKIIKTMEKGDVLTVDTKADTSEEWVAVEAGSGTSYVSAEYVLLSYQTGKAISIEEEKAAIEAAKQEKAKEAAASSVIKTTQGKAVEANTDDETLLAAIIQCEAGNQSYECQLAVGAVVMNRVKSSRYPNSISKVIYQSGQFGPVTNGSLSRRLKNGVSSTARRAAKAAISGKDNTGGCLYFNAASTGHSGTRIGAVVFW